MKRQFELAPPLITVECKSKRSKRLSDSSDGSHDSATVDAENIVDLIRKRMAIKNPGELLSDTESLHCLAFDCGQANCMVLVQGETVVFVDAGGTLNNEE